MKKKLNLILSCASLLVTVALLIVTVFSWYVVNEEAKAENIVANTAGDDLSFELSYYDKTSSSWKLVTEELEFENVLPGFYQCFRLTCHNSGESNINITGAFEGIESNLDTTFVKVSGNKITYNTIPQYTINSVSNAVVIDNQILYKVQGTAISLGAYLIENGYRIQYYGTAETTEPTFTKIDDLPTDGSVMNVNSSIFENLTVTPSGLNLYFSLIYLDDDELNPYYMYQSLYLASFVVKKV